MLRSDAPAAITRFTARWNSFAKTNSRISHLSRLHSDAAGEFRAAAFLDLLANENIDKSFAPPEVPQLNGVAERAIRTVFAHVRADLVASGAPKSFWTFAALQAIDTINRTTSPPKSDLSSYELVTGDKPRVMGIITWGCQAFAVKQTRERRKSSLDSAAHVGMLLGRNPEQPGAFFMWLPDHKKIISASDVYVQETYMP